MPSGVPPAAGGVVVTVSVDATASGQPQPQPPARVLTEATPPSPTTLPTGSPSPLARGLAQPSVGIGSTCNPQSGIREALLERAAELFRLGQEQPDRAAAASGALHRPWA